MKKNIPNMISATALALCMGCSTTDTEQPDGKVWRKGALHCHTLWSDGRSLPETAVQTYKNLGYDFMCIADHNVYPEGDLWLPVQPETGPWPCNLSFVEYEHANKLMKGNVISKTISFRTYVKLRTMKELQELFNEEDKFLLVPGEEITVMGLKFNDRPGTYQNHFNVFNIAKTFPPLSGKTGTETVKKNFEQYKKAVNSNPAHSFFMVNHPYSWAWDVDPVTVLDNPEITHFEICNNGSAIPVDHIFSAEKFWDFILAHRLDRGQNIIYGTATDDSHFYIDAVGKYAGNNLGWVMVNCPGKMTGNSLAEALNRGDFYATNGVILEDVTLDSNAKTLTVKVKAEKNVNYQIRFIVTNKNFDRSIEYREFPAKEPKYTRKLPIIPENIGTTALTVKGSEGSYKLKDDDLYVRAVVISDKKSRFQAPLYPETECAWTQPLVNKHLK